MTRIDETIGDSHACAVCHTAPCDCDEIDEGFCMGCFECLAKMDDPYEERFDDDDEQEDEE